MSWRNKLVKMLQIIYDDKEKNHYFPEHWFDHGLRVEKLALWLVKQDELENKIDSEILIATALLHDIGYLWSDDYDHISQSMKLAEKILPKTSCPEHKINKVSKCILYHDTVPERPGWKDDLPIECRIVADADAIESSGYLGIIRFASWSGRHEIPLWVLNEKDTKTNVFPQIGIINNIEIRIPELINRCFSLTARKIIEKRWIDMQKFIDGFKKELQFIENL